jgi:hypothetical protein
MHHDNGRAISFVEVMVFQPVKIEEIALERIFGSKEVRQIQKKLLSRLLKTAISPPSSKALLCGVALLRLRGAFCGCDDLTIFEQPVFFNLLGVLCG